MSIEKVALAAASVRNEVSRAQPRRGIGIALVAEARKEPDLMDLARAHEPVLRGHRLYAASRTRHHLEEACGGRLPFVPLGEKQIYPMIERGEMDLVILLVDSSAGARDESAALELLRLCNARGIPVATNVPTAGLLLGVLASGEMVWKELVLERTSPAQNAA
jgi:methylglyoxal synthase